ncbi:unnamed protein product [Gongylonema pulchrum]|uniref:Uncharacterized protein n=1 Tax=Gongylonema pulchrum TaxID=637853 RepID=A0A183ENT1_9BILA|nr:unnamed protein product [Gongylonema pulchrum]
MDEHGTLRPVLLNSAITGKQKQQREHQHHHRSTAIVDKGEDAPEELQQACANDSFILETILKKYNRHKIPGDSVSVQVEVWVQEITTISDITSDFQVLYFLPNIFLLEFHRRLRRAKS